MLRRTQMTVETLRNVQGRMKTIRLSFYTEVTKAYKHCLSYGHALRGTLCIWSNKTHKCTYLHYLKTIRTIESRGLAVCDRMCVTPRSRYA